MLMLSYHAPVGHAAKVLILLTEKGLPWTRGAAGAASHGRGLPPASHAGGFPVLIDGDAVLTESSVILEYLEERWPMPRLLPVDVIDRWRARAWCKVVNEDLAPATGILAWTAWTFPSLDEEGRADLATRFAEGRSVERRLFWQEAVRGFSECRIADAERKIEDVVQRIEEALAATGYLAGPAYSLADIDMWPFASVLPRLAPHVADAGRAPRLADWIERIGRRSAIMSATSGARDSDWLPGPETIRWG